MGYNRGMDADLSRATAKVFNSPLWAYTALRKGGKGSDEFQAYQQQVTEALIEAGTLKALPEPMKAYFDQCDRSYDIAAEQFAGRGAGFLSPDELQAIAEAVAVATEDV